MRCPSLIAYDPGVHVLNEAKQKLLTKAQLKAMRVLKNGKTVSDWMRTGQRGQFDEDIKAGSALGTDYFVTHYFLQGREGHFEEIIDRMKLSPDGGNNSYEMVVHPVAYKYESDYYSMPKGVKTGKFHLRRKEGRRLREGDDFRTYVDNKNIDIY